MGEIIYPFGLPKDSAESVGNTAIDLETDRIYRASNKREIRKVIQKLESLPSLPAVAGRILSLLTEEDPDLDEVVKLIEADQAITLRLLRMAGSAAVGGRITSVSRAILMLGFTQIRSLLLSIVISESLIKSLGSSSGSEQLALWKHCLACAVAAEMIAEHSCPKYKTEAFIAGLVHDIGKLVLHESLPEKYSQVSAAHSEKDLSWLEAEQNILGVDHSIVGKWLAEKWGLPELLTHAIWLHHHPVSAILELDFVKKKEVVLAVKLASGLAHTAMADSVSAYRTESDQEEILSVLRLKSDNLREISASVGKRYSERAAIFDMEEDELSFYFQALQRANQELARMALKSGEHKPIEKAVAHLQLLHDLQLKLARVQDADEVLIRIAHILKSNFEKKQGVIYIVDGASRKLAGRCWTSNKKAPQPFSVDLDAEGRPVRDMAPLLDDLLITKLVKTRNSRFLRTTGEPHKTNLLQYCTPYLIVPLVMGGNLAGEIILLDETKDSPSSPLSDMNVKIYGYLASITASALASIQVSEREQDVSENLSKALQKNALIMSHLKQAMQRFEYLFEYSNDAIILHNMDGKIIRINQRSVEFLGYTTEEFEGLSMLQLLPASESNAAADALKALWRNERGGRLELKLQHKDGRLFDSNMSSRIVDLSSGLVQSILRDISLRKQGERDLAAEKERLAVTLRSIGEGVITTNKAGAVVMINKIAEELTGFTEDESIHKPLDEVFHIVHAKTRARYDGLVKQVLESGESVNIANHVILLSRNGVERSISASCAPIRDRQGMLIGVVLVFRDVTEKLKMEKEVLKAQKLESIGVFAGGIAHDFNNILSAIIGNVSLAKMIIKSGGSATDRLEDAEKASYRARDLTGQLLSFSRGGAPVKKTASIVEIIKDSASFVLSGSNVRCEFNIPEDLWPVEADVGQISQVISNMVINAQQAMPGGGVIYLRAENIHDVKELSIPATSKDYVRISIEDHGVGIPEENLHKIFDPYFTTKSKGNGLGLATSYSIIANHGGCITVESEPNERTIFQIYLPASSEQFTMEKPREGNQHIGKGKILIMDDEESVRTTLGMMLEYVGYEVGYAKDGSEAVDLYRQSMDSGRAFNAVLMDLTVPGGMGGEEAMKRLRELDPQVNAIISSGYFHEPIIVGYKDYGFRAAITKPFRMEELNKILPKVLAGITV